MSGEITLTLAQIQALQGQYAQVREIRELAERIEQLAPIIGKTDKTLEGMLFVAMRTCGYVAGLLEQRLPQTLESILDARHVGETPTVKQRS